MITSANRPEVKICGLTRPETARACAEAGVDAVGCVFYPPSPRHVDPVQAREISRAVSGLAAVIGVFVNETAADILETARTCGLSGVQLHGAESPALVSQLQSKGLFVIKTLFADKSPDFNQAAAYQPAPCLVECGHGRLPGGNAQTWDWGRAAGIKPTAPLILAGGLSPENIAAAVAAARPDAVDISSGVEDAPGQKNLDRVRRLLAQLPRPANLSQTPLRRIFK